ncbi:MAG: hypothetical protein V4515_12385 [Chloroflexota bacterium]
MGVKLIVDVAAPDDILRDYAAGALLRWERGTVAAGPFVEQGTVGIVAATYQYEIYDATGTTAHFYRTRYSNAAATQLSDYSAVLSPGAPDTYATMDDLLLAVPHVPTESRTLARMSAALRAAKRRLDRELGGVDFLRHPASGTEVRYYRGENTARLHVHEGLLSVTQVRIKLSPTSSWTTLGTTDYDLDPPQPLSGEPFFHLILNGTGSYRTWPRTYRGVEVTGVFGWATPPIDAVDANIEWARQSLAAGSSFQGGQSGPPDLGSPVGPQLMPDAVYRLRKSQSERFLECWS